MKNIVLIGTDSLRADHCNCYGYDRETTPFLNKIATDGLKFENAIVSGLPTPTSIFGMFTGKYSPVNNKVVTQPKPWRSTISKFLTIAEKLSEEGYNTYGLTLNPLVSEYYGFNKGFEYSFGGMWKGSSKDISNSLWLRTKKLYLIPLLQKLKIWLEVSHLKNYIMANAGCDRGEKILTEIKKLRLREPYFLWIFFIDTHLPYIPPSKFLKGSKVSTRKIIKLNYRMCKEGKKLYKNPQLMAQQKLKPKITPNEQKSIIAAYDGEILHTDNLIKQVWEHLNDTDPAFIFFSDHGDGFAEHKFYGHPPEHYEYLIRVPLIIYNADVKGVVEEPVSFLRLAPTICELAGVKNKFKNPSLFEENLYTPPIVENRLENGLRITVRDKEWKLITDPDREDELYNIIKDPLEQENLIGEEKEVEKKLRQQIKSHKKMKEVERVRKKIRTLRK